MRISAAKVLFLGSVAACGLAIGALERSRQLQSEGNALLGQAAEAAEAFVQAFEGEHQDREFELLDLRRSTLADASSWQAAGRLAFALSALLLFATWVARELARLQRPATRPQPAHLPIPKALPALAPAARPRRPPISPGRRGLVPR